MKAEGVLERNVGPEIRRFVELKTAVISLKRFGCIGQ